MIRAVVGAGGKTTWIRRWTKAYLKQGYKVFVTTSTHMYIEEDTVLTDDADSIIRQLNTTHYVMAGLQEGGKIKPLSRKTYEKVCHHADVVLIEADGSRHMPLKYPDGNEPVIYDNVDEIVVIYGLHGLQREAREAVQRLELANRVLHVTEDTRITTEHIRTLVTKGYVEPLRARFPDKKITVQPGQLVGCVIMASGQSRRFGANKLLQEFRGETLFQRVLNLTGGDLFAKRVVVTRNKEVQELCRQQDIEVIYHGMPDRNDVVRLGIHAMQEMDGCMFCPCDQPLLQRKSVERLVSEFAAGQAGILRLAYGERQGTPVLFGKPYFGALSQLPSKCGGSYVVRQHPEDVALVPVENEAELFDIDTREDYERLLSR